MTFTARLSIIKVMLLSDSITEKTVQEHIFTAITHASAADDVRKQLVALIESGVLKVDSRLPSEHVLAKRFGVSRPVVREALAALQVLGLTTVKNGKGTFVISNRMTVPNLMGRYSPKSLNQVRRFLEVPAARLAALNRTDEDLGRLAEIIARLEDSEDTAERNTLDVSFHLAIAKASGNPLMVMLIEVLRGALEEQSFAASNLPDRRSGAITEHRAIYHAIVRRDQNAAAEAMEGHVNAVDSTFLMLENRVK